MKGKILLKEAIVRPPNKFKKKLKTTFVDEEEAVEQHLTLWDLILTPIYLLILISIGKSTRDKRYPIGNPLRIIYMRGLYVKLGGAILIALIYQYYYGGHGDTYNFFSDAQVISSALGDGFSTWFNLITHAPLDEHPELYSYIARIRWYDDPAAFTVSAVASILGIFNGTSYIPIALLFAYFSFTGVWAMYLTFVRIYPKLYKYLAIAFFYIPSTFIWGSAIFKDTICMFGLGWLTYTTFRIFVDRNFSPKNIFLLALSFYIIYVVKIYILLAFIPALSVWLLTTYSSKITSTVVRVVVRFAFIGVTVVVFLFAARAFALELEKYSLEKIAKTAATTRNYINKVSDSQDGSSYDLGEFDPSIGGMVKKFPQAVVVTLFRPFPWEARKVFVVLSAVEAVAFIYFTIQAFRRRGIKNALVMINKDPNLFFCLVFALIFAFAVGISSYNFGALSRYKIPCMPFFATVLVVLLYKDKVPETKKEAKRSVAYRRPQPAI